MSKEQNNEKYRVKNTKISPDMEPVLDAVCDALDVNIYDLLQWFCYTMIRAASPQHELTPEIQKILTLLESDAGWKNAFNIANPAKLKVAQVVLILEQEGRKGFGAVMVDKPFMGKARQTECVDDILERVTEVTMRGIYRKLRLLGARMECANLSDVLMTLIDGHTIQALDEADRRAILAQTPDNIASNGIAYEYGAKTKGKKHRTPDSLANQQQRIVFDDYDATTTDEPADKADSGDDMVNSLGCKPFDVEP